MRGIRLNLRALIATVVVLLVLTAISVTALISPYWDPDTATLPSVPPQVETARALVAVGDPRDAAVEALSPGAWYHSDCRVNASTVDDVFLYGPREKAKVRVVLLRSRWTDGQALVEFIGTVEPDQLASFGACIPEGVFED